MKAQALSPRMTPVAMTHEYRSGLRSAHEPRQCVDGARDEAYLSYLRCVLRRRITSKSPRSSTHDQAQG